VSSGGINPMTDFRQWWPTNVNILAQKADFFNSYKNASWNLLTAAYTTGNALSYTRPAYHDNLYFNRYVNFESDGRSRYFGNANGGLVVAGFFALSNSVNNPTAPAENYQRKEVDGMFTGATISYKELLTIDGTLRRDQSSTLPKGNNTYFYPAISGNLIFSKL